MKSLWITCVVMILTSTSGFAKTIVNVPLRPDRPIAFIDVHVIPMDTKRVLPSQTVIVEKGRIAQIGPSKTITVPEGIRTIKGSGKFLMPGLADMHVHLQHPAHLTLYIANGVTTIRNMSGSKRELLWRRHINGGSLLGPTIYTAGPILDGPGSDVRAGHARQVIHATAGTSASLVRAQKDARYNFIKVHDRITADAYSTIVSAAKTHNIPVVGHVPWAVGLNGALNAGQSSIEHLSGYVESIQRSDAPNAMHTTWWHGMQAFNTIDESKVDGVAQSIKRAGVWSSPTLVATQRFLPGAQATMWLEQPAIRFIHPSQRALWRTLRIRGVGSVDLALMTQAHQTRLNMVRALHKAGAKILLGTDAMAPYVVPGFSIHDELQHLMNAGLSPYEAIRAGTSDAAEFLGKSDRFGTIAVGKRADLILLSANPLTDVSHIKTPDGVMVRGQWFSKRRLDKKLERIAMTYLATEGKTQSKASP